MKNNELAVTNNSGFLALKENNFADFFAEEMEGLTPSFERIKIPAGGATTFEMPGENADDPETVKEFSAVILYQHPIYAYYKDKYTGGSNPPDCGSFDGNYGEGNPGGNCKTCPFNQFGSGENGAKACKNRRRIYLLIEGESFPMILSLPTGSLKDFTRYLMRQLSKGNKPNMVVTKFSLKKATNSNGIAFSQAQFAFERKLTDEEYKLVSGLSEQVKALQNSVGYDVEENISVDNTTGEIIEPLK